LVSREEKRVVLYVDDDGPNRLLMARLFARHRPGDELVCASSAREALEQAREKPPHLVLLDVNLGDASGEEVLRTLKAERAVPVVMLSGELDARGRLLEQGADAYMTKPMDVRELLGVIDSLMGLHPDDNE